MEMLLKLKKYIPLLHSRLIRQWWKSQQDIDLDINSMLSDLGYIAYQEGMPIAACWLYFTNSPVAWLGFPIANPEADSETRNVALDQIFDKLHLEAGERGHKLIWTTSAVKPIQERLGKHGYTLGDKQVNQYWKAVSRETR